MLVEIFIYLMSNVIYHLTFAEISFVQMLHRSRTAVAPLERLKILLQVDFPRFPFPFLFFDLLASFHLLSVSFLPVA